MVLHFVTWTGTSVNFCWNYNVNYDVQLTTNHDIDTYPEVFSYS